MHSCGTWANKEDDAMCPASNLVCITFSILPGLIKHRISVSSDGRVPKYGGR